MPVPLRRARNHQVADSGTVKTLLVVALRFVAALQFSLLAKILLVAALRFSLFESSAPAAMWQPKKWKWTGGNCHAPQET